MALRRLKYNAQNLGDATNPKWSLLVTTYGPGKITRELKDLGEGGVITSRVLTLNQWPQEDPEEEPFEPVTFTGIDRNTITFIPNFLVRDIAVSDYDGLVEQQDLLNAKRTQMARVLAQHSDPAMAMPTRNFKPDGTLDSEYKVFAFDQADMIPKYITWDAQLASAYADFMEVRSAILLESETSPILLGIKDHATAHSAYKSVRLEATNSLTKAQRKAVIFRACVKRMIGVAQDLDQTLPGERYDRQEIGLEMNDGLPIDTDAQANEISTLRSAGVMSVARAVGILIADPASREKEIAALEAEKAAATPSILLGGGGEAGEVADAEGAAQEDVTGQASTGGVGLE